MSGCEHCSSPTSCGGWQSISVPIEYGAAVPAELGASNHMDRSWKIAIHEAAHAVFAVMSYGVVRIATIQGGKGLAGYVDYQMIRTPQTEILRTLTLLAGPIAQDLVEENIDPSATRLNIALTDQHAAALKRLMEHRPERSCGRDHCAALLCIIKDWPDEPAAKMTARFMELNQAALLVLSDARIWRAVKSVATLLMVDGSIDHDAVAHCFGRYAKGLSLKKMLPTIL